VIKRFSKYQIATSLAILFHIIGLTGILFFKNDFFIRSTAFNLLLMFGLLLWTHEEINKSFIIFIAACFIVGVTVEIIGVNTKLIFGDYRYGDVLGPKLMSVPLIIGINWFIIIYCCGVSVHTLLMNIINRSPATSVATPQLLKALSIIIDGAVLAVLFDWMMEPVAVKLDFWTWNGKGTVPFYNYLCWFLVSVLLLAIFHFCKFEKQNKFAVNLLLVQFMFFLILRSFLN
jgi:bisanhydrobacterioruberin hydratase